MLYYIGKKIFRLSSTLHSKFALKMIITARQDNLKHFPNTYQNFSWKIDVYGRLPEKYVVHPFLQITWSQFWLCIRITSRALKKKGQSPLQGSTALLRFQPNGPNDSIHRSQAENHSLRNIPLGRAQVPPSCPPVLCCLALELLLLSLEPVHLPTFRNRILLLDDSHKVIFGDPRKKFLSS